jgi:toxin-antitoxin system, antitoxin component, hicB family
MLKATYTAVLHPEVEAGGYSVSFPDLPGCYTQGDTLEEALAMAGDALGIYLYTLKEDGLPFPAASAPGKIRAETGDFTTLVAWDEANYLRRTDTHAVKKTLTIPAWMDSLAKEHHVNFSQLLQTALRRELGVEA